MVVALIFPFCAGPLLCSSMLKLILLLEQCRVVRRRTPSEVSVESLAPPRQGFIFCHNVVGVGLWGIKGFGEINIYTFYFSEISIITEYRALHTETVSFPC